ncbi:MAG: hypothetical protein H0X54_07775 [Propionibacteriales bacterium]|jgi:hypothetical protein|nr:hypothetical protein [Propionibacteriales bacterium]
MSGDSDTRMPGDDVVPHPDLVMDRVLEFDAARETVWPWLVQLGKRRAGWYMPRSVEIFVPASRRALRHLDGRWLDLAVGDVVPDWGPGTPQFEVFEIDAPSHLVYLSRRPRTPRRGHHRPPLKLTWALALSDLVPQRSRLRLRLRIDLGHRAGPVATYGGGCFDWATVELMGRGLDERLRDSSR